ncbi:MAG: tripartite tricarboxylate transporter substrate binding protein [Burkholderiales bacterium]|jgi:tripartite-type tricarboxylate transporter receptor subunit TctC
MRRSRRGFTAGVATLAAAAALPAPARAQSAPALRYVVPTGPGGPTDTMLRTAHKRVEVELGQSIVLDYKPGSAGIAAIQAGLAAPADGRTLMGVYTSLAFNPWTFERLPYDTFTDLDPVSLLVEIPLVLAAGPAVPVETVPELVAWAKANPGRLTIAASGLGGGSHLGGLLLAAIGGFEVTVVPYKGGADALPDLLAGRIGLMLDSYQTLAAQAQAGKLRLLGVASERRQDFAPTLAPISQAISGFATASWQGVVVRAGTPAAERDRLARAYAAAMRDPEVRGSLVERGFEPVGGTPQAFARTIRADHEKWGPIIRKAGLKSG